MALAGHELLVDLTPLHQYHIPGHLQPFCDNCPQETIVKIHTTATLSATQGPLVATSVSLLSPLAQLKGHG